MATLDEQVDAFRTRRLDAAYPYVWLEARYEYEGIVVSIMPRLYFGG